MNAIVPLNIAAIRVNRNDADKVVGNFQGKTAAFDSMPWADPNAPRTYEHSASTGDKIFQPLGISPGGNPINSPIELGAGIHLHWELPDYFKKGKQTPESRKIVFPHAPNRWLVTRYLSEYDQSASVYKPATNRSWIVESDYVTSQKSSGPRPVISVPLPTTPAFGQQPYSYMGRVVDLSSWDPSTPASNYLPAYKGTDGNSLYLTSVGFVGPYFGSYYPECCSVFGFWDNFSNSDVQGLIASNASLLFRATYQVIGWLSDATTDPLNNIAAQVTTEYNQYVQKCVANNTDPQLTPLDIFRRITQQTMKWTFNEKDLSFTVKDHKITELNLPTQTICAGTAQEVVWNMTSNQGSTYFLASDGTNPSVWSAQTEIAIGNSTEEALSALLKKDMQSQSEAQNVLDNYEYLLDALQLGLLTDIEKTPNKFIALEEALHNNGFSSFAGGLVWLITDTGDVSDDQTETEEVSLPLELAEQLALLNAAQKNYDMGRSALSIMRKQLFMDWVRFIKMFMGETADQNITQVKMNDFILTSSGGELKNVIDSGKDVGIIVYGNDSAVDVLRYTAESTSGLITGITLNGKVPTTSRAYSVFNNFNAVSAALADFNKNNKGSNWILQTGKADSFHLPSEPVVLMEGDRIEPPQRNGDGDTTFVRLSQELLSQLQITFEGNKFTVSGSSLAGMPALSTGLPSSIQSDVQALTEEAVLITPMLAPVVTAALAAAGGTNNPAIASPQNCTTSLMYAQGGLSTLDVSPNMGGVPTPPASSLFATVYADDYKPAANTIISVAAPLALQVEFTNANKNGWAPDNAGWITQLEVPGFPSTRFDPFLPIFMIWNVSMSPLQWEQDKLNQFYSETNITDFFTLDNDGVDYVYKMSGGAAVPFSSSNTVSYEDDATMRSGATGVLSYQITNFLANNPDDPEKQTLLNIAALYNGRKFLSQSMSGFNTNQVLAAYVAQVAVENLVSKKTDNWTPKVSAAALATPHDNWYDDAFTSLEPISTGLLAQGNFGPLRAGFMDVIGIEIVDAFGQRMDLTTANTTSRGALECVTSYAMSPASSDNANKGRIYLAPRILAPTRVWFKWLSATHNDAVPGITGDFVETNTHPATAPICGWVMPNHLDNNLFFYDADGTAIGTFGIEGGAVVYRTRAGNTGDSPDKQLEDDIGSEGHPTKNAHLANFMWYLSKQSGDFLEDLMTAIQTSDTFISPANFANTDSLALLIGRPLALTRAVLGLETSGKLLPLSQADNNSNSPFPQDVNKGRTLYTDRMQYSSANLANVLFPARLGDLANLDDGLVGYIVETAESNPYLGQSFFTPAAGKDWKGGVVRPTPTTVQLKLNETPKTITMLVDPVAAVHATTGILGVSELSIPPDQYSAIMNSLAVNFVTRPMLSMAQGLTVPLPEENGYVWSYITPGAKDPTPLKANAVNETPAYGYTPQTLIEGWLVLTPKEK